LRPLATDALHAIACSYRTLPRANVHVPNAIGQQQPAPVRGRTRAMSSSSLPHVRVHPLLYGEPMTTCVMVRRVRGADALGVASTR
jgi:hypothetical protein